jgi:putative RecB family exonuclease
MAAPVARFVSHSQIAQYQRCGKQFELERIARYPAPPTWYFIGGSAVHKATERLDQIPMEEWTSDRIEHLWSQAYEEGISEAYEIWPNEREWLKAGRVSRNNKDGQGYRFWNLRGRDATFAWANWRKTHPEYRLVETEFAFEVPIGDHLVRGYIDRVFEHPDHGLTVVDLKTGSKRPDNPLQLALYRAAWNLSREAKVNHGAWFMTKDGELFPQDLSPYTDQILSRMIDQYLAGVEADVFLPNVGAVCFSCPMKPACAAAVGPTEDALAYDSLLKETVSA